MFGESLSHLLHYTVRLEVPAGGTRETMGNLQKIIVSVYMGFSPIRALFTIRPI